jgi:hypothetical protein
MRVLSVCCVVVTSLTAFASVVFADQIANANGSNKGMLNQQQPHQQPPAPPKPPPKKPPQEQPKKN